MSGPFYDTMPGPEHRDKLNELWDAAVQGGAVVDYVSNSDPRLSDAREWIAPTMHGSDIFYGTSSERMAASPGQLRLAIEALSEYASLTREHRLSPHVRNLFLNLSPRVFFLGYVIPQFRIEDVVTGAGTGIHPAFIYDGRPMKRLLIGRVCSTVSTGSGSAATNYYARATTSLTIDAARSIVAQTVSTAKSVGQTATDSKIIDTLHLMTNWEWSALTMLAVARGFQPGGNTYYGRNNQAPHECGVRFTDDLVGDPVGDGRIFNGSGPSQWNHNGERVGIADLTGNVREWVDGVKLVDGRVHINPDNTWDRPESEWVAQDLWFTGSNSGASGTLSLVDNAESVIRNGELGSDLNSGFSDSAIKWANMAVNGTAPELARQALIAPFTGVKTVGGATLEGQASARTYGTRYAARGGNCVAPTTSGLGSIHFTTSASGTFSTTGFRMCAFWE